MPKKNRKTKTSNRFRLSDPIWKRIEPLLPVHVNRHRFGGGRPPVPNRDAMDAIFFVLRTGCQWNALNETGICTSSSAHRRFQEWTQAGVFKKLWANGLEEYDELKGIQWRWQSMDGAMTKAPLGGEKNRTQSDGSSQGRRQTQSAV
jgi:transposase